MQICSCFGVSRAFKLFTAQVKATHSFLFVHKFWWDISRLPREELKKPGLKYEKQFCDLYQNCVLGLPVKENEEPN